MEICFFYYSQIDTFFYIDNVRNMRGNKGFEIVWKDVKATEIRSSLSFKWNYRNDKNEAPTKSLFYFVLD